MGEFNPFHCMEFLRVNDTGIARTTFKGVGEVLGIGSGGTPIGSGFSFIVFRSSTGTAFSCLTAVNGIAPLQLHRVSHSDLQSHWAG
ncbi:MAG: hypothetical protein CM15mV12_3210 [uncultured marine virus]|nr:MAG: hypothetical protein CM15mV12_3210 [uncultured marine virus]